MYVWVHVLPCDGVHIRAFPWYNGGAPMAKTPWADRSKDYTCTTSAADGTCVQWTSHELASNKYKVGACECDGAEDGAVCDSWYEPQR